MPSFDIFSSPSVNNYFPILAYSDTSLLIIDVICIYLFFL